MCYVYNCVYCMCLYIAVCVLKLWCFFLLGVLNLCLYICVLFVFIYTCVCLRSMCIYLSACVFYLVHLGRR